MQTVLGQEQKLKLDKDNMLLYVVTDRTWLAGRSLVIQVEKAILGGATFIQLREKDLSFDEFVSIAKEVKVVTDRYHIPFVINDRVDVALAVKADGVHIGQDDLAAFEVRKLIGELKILGVSVQTREQALQAQQHGADYVGVGAVFSTATKMDADEVSFQELQNICSAITIPVVAIGGINKTNLLELRESGIDGVAVISAIFAQPDITKATSELLMLARETVGMK